MVAEHKITYEHHIKPKAWWGWSCACGAAGFPYKTRTDAVEQAAKHLLGRADAR